MTWVWVKLDCWVPQCKSKPGFIPVSPHPMRPYPMSMAKATKML